MAAAEPPFVEPAITGPTIVEPAIVEPAITEMAAAEPPFAEPPFDEPPFDEPTFAEPTIDQPAVAQAVPTPDPLELPEEQTELQFSGALTNITEATASGAGLSMAPAPAPPSSKQESLPPQRPVVAKGGKLKKLEPGQQATLTPTVKPTVPPTPQPTDKPKFEKPSDRQVVAAPYHQPLKDQQLRSWGPSDAARAREVAKNLQRETSRSVAAAPEPRSLSTEPLIIETTTAAPNKRAVEILAKACERAALAESVADFSEVVQQCRHVLAIDRSESVVSYARELASWALNKRGELKADVNEQAEALIDFDESLRLHSSRWRALHNRGVLHAQAGEYAQAFNDFNEVIRINPTFAKAHSNRASLYVQAGDFQSALDDYRQAITLNPDLAVAHKGRGRVCHMLGLMDEAMQHFDAAVLLAPNDAHIAACRADLMVDNARYAQAVAGYKQAIALDPTLATAYRNLAWLEATCPDPRFRDGEAAIKHATRALELTGDEDDVSLDTLAAAYATASEFDSAVAVIRRAIAVSSGLDATAYAQRLRLYESGRLFLSSPVSEVQQTSY